MYRNLQALILFVLAVCACDARRPQAYITPAVRFNKAAVAMGTPLEVTYVFRTSNDFDGLKKDLTVFVHFLDPRGVIRFVDDHTPPLLTNQWGRGQEYSYTRTVFVPENIPPGEYVVELGMYTPSGKGERFALKANRLSERSYDVGHFAVQPLPAGADGEYVRGWYDVEREPGNPWEHWRWISSSAVLRVRNPGADAILYLKTDTDRSRFPEPQKVTVYLGDMEVGAFAMESNEPVVQKFPLRVAQLGHAATLDLRLEVDHTFTPGGADSRNLGIRIYSFYLGRATE
ncbi:MAG TPA: hypothetical protein VLR94_10705 [Acidobacteriota bacterium]|nr:hypothetical protein [Acidobacteriota bacterium]